MYVFCFRFANTQLELTWIGKDFAWKQLFMFYLCFVRLSYLELTSYFLFQAKRVVLYLGRAQPVKTLDELMVELQTVETLNCMIERTETPPFYRQVKHYDRNNE
jgi:hypothetical protein